MPVALLHGSTAARLVVFLLVLFLLFLVVLVLEKLSVARALLDVRLLHVEVYDARHLPGRHLALVLGAQQQRLEHRHQRHQDILCQRLRVGVVEERSLVDDVADAQDHLDQHRDKRQRALQQRVHLPGDTPLDAYGESLSERFITRRVRGSGVRHWSKNQKGKI